MVEIPTYLGVSMAASALCALAILVSRPYHIARTAKGHAGTARQSSHTRPTPRLGGVVLIFGVLSGMMFMDEAAQLLLGLVLLSAVPVFAGGIGEDTGFNVSARKRLALAALSSVLAMTLFGVWIPPINLPVLETVMGIPILAMILTVLVSSGVCHSINLVDGLNGLAIGICVLVAFGLLAIAHHTGDDEIVIALKLFLACVGVIFFFNFPRGLIFFGDSGAYTAGHILTWIGLLLLNRNPEIAPSVMLLVFFWPITEMLWSICRRLISGKPISMPDRLHFHQVLMRVLEVLYFGKDKLAIVNPLTTVFILPVAVVPMVAAHMVLKSDGLSLLCMIIGWGFFVLIYRILSRVIDLHDRVV
ncbi:MAG: glycosyltransferase [Pseudomonadota bacterium]|nr:glycosyltransferase [Pseudomonadota bacterium]